MRRCALHTTGVLYVPEGGQQAPSNMHVCDHVRKGEGQLMPPQHPSRAYVQLARGAPTNQ